MYRNFINNEYLNYFGLNELKLHLIILIVISIIFINVLHN
jgi:hypothetical protein